MADPDKLEQAQSTSNQSVAGLIIVRDKISELEVVKDAAGSTIGEFFRLHFSTKSMLRNKRLSNQNQIAFECASDIISRFISRWIRDWRSADKRDDNMILHETHLTSSQLNDETFPSNVKDSRSNRKDTEMWLLIETLEAINLCSMRWNGKNDPYAIIRLGDLSKTSPVKWEAGSSASWSNLDIAWTNISSEKSSSNETQQLIIEIHNANFARGDQLIGKNSFSLDELEFNQPIILKNDIYIENSPKSRGQLSLKITLNEGIPPQDLNGSAPRPVIRSPKIFAETPEILSKSSHSSLFDKPSKEVVASQLSPSSKSKKRHSNTNKKELDDHSSTETTASKMKGRIDSVKKGNKVDIPADSKSTSSLRSESRSKTVAKVDYSLKKGEDSNQYNNSSRRETGGRMIRPRESEDEASDDFDSQPESNDDFAHIRAPRLHAMAPYKSRSVLNYQNESKNRSPSPPSQLTRGPSQRCSSGVVPIVRQKATERQSSSSSNNNNNNNNNKLDHKKHSPPASPKIKIKGKVSAPSSSPSVISSRTKLIDMYMSEAFQKESLNLTTQEVIIILQAVGCEFTLPAQDTIIDNPEVGHENLELPLSISSTSLAAILTSFCKDQHLISSYRGVGTSSFISPKKAELITKNLSILVKGPWKHVRRQILRSCEGKEEGRGGRPSWWSQSLVSNILSSLELPDDVFEDLDARSFIEYNANQSQITNLQTIPTVLRARFRVYQHIIRLIEQGWDRGLRPSDSIKTSRRIHEKYDLSGLHVPEDRKSRLSSKEKLNSSILSKSGVRGSQHNSGLVKLKSPHALVQAWIQLNRVYGWGASLQQLSLLSAALGGVMGKLTSISSSTRHDDDLSTSNDLYNEDDTSELRWIEILGDSTDKDVIGILQSNQVTGFISGTAIRLSVHCYDCYDHRLSDDMGKPSDVSSSLLSDMNIDDIKVGTRVHVVPYLQLKRACERFDWWDRPEDPTLKEIADSTAEIISIQEIDSKKRVGLKFDNLKITDALPLQALFLEKESGVSPSRGRGGRGEAAEPKLKMKDSPRKPMTFKASTSYKDYYSFLEEPEVGKSQQGGMWSDANRKHHSVNRSDNNRKTPSEKETTPQQLTLEEPEGGDEAINDMSGSDSEQARGIHDSLMNLSKLAKGGHDKAVRLVSEEGRYSSRSSGKRPLYRPNEHGSSKTNSLNNTKKSDADKSRTSLQLNPQSWLNPNKPMSLEVSDEVQVKYEASNSRRIDSTRVSLQGPHVINTSFDNDHAIYDKYSSKIRDHHERDSLGDFETLSLENKLHIRNVKNITQNAKKAHTLALILSPKKIKQGSTRKLSLDEREGGEAKLSDDDIDNDFLSIHGNGLQKSSGKGVGTGNPSAKERPRSASVIKSSKSVLHTHEVKLSSPVTQFERMFSKKSVPSRPRSASAIRPGVAPGKAKIPPSPERVPSRTHGNASKGAKDYVKKKILEEDDNVIKMRHAEKLDREIKRTEKQMLYKENALKRQLKKYGIDPKEYDSYTNV